MKSHRRVKTCTLGASPGWKARVGRRSKFPEEFRQRAAHLVLDGRRSVRDVGGEPAVTERRCPTGAAKRRQRAVRPAALSADERLELDRLRCKVAEPELERKT